MGERITIKNKFQLQLLTISLHDPSSSSESKTESHPSSKETTRRYPSSHISPLSGPLLSSLKVVFTFPRDPFAGASVERSLSC